MARESFTTDKIAAPVGPFSPAVRAGEFVYLSGQVAQDPTGGRLIEGDLAAQTELIFQERGSGSRRGEKDLRRRHQGQRVLNRYAGLRRDERSVRTAFRGAVPGANDRSSRVPSPGCRRRDRHRGAVRPPGRT